MSDAQIRDTVLYLQALHCQQHHGNVLQVQPGCATCFALAAALPEHATPHPLQTAGVGQKGLVAPPTRRGR
jgi:hypothetical protein